MDTQISKGYFRDVFVLEKGYIFTLRGTTVSWKSKLQHRVALSTMEAEYIAISTALEFYFSY